MEGWWPTSIAWPGSSDAEVKRGVHDKEAIENAFASVGADNRMHSPSNYQWEPTVFLAGKETFPFDHNADQQVKQADKQADITAHNAIIPQSTMDAYPNREAAFTQQFPVTENECLMRIAALQRKVEILKLEVDEGHDRLRTLGDKDEHATFIKERVGNKWIIEGLMCPSHGEANIDCGAKDNVEVSVRDCNGYLGGPGVESNVIVRVQGKCQSIRVSRSSYLKLYVESCSLEMVLLNCENITIVIGGHAPKIKVEDSHDIELNLCFHLFVESIYQLRSWNIVLVGYERQGIPILSTQDIINAKPTAKTIVDVPSNVQLVLRDMNAGGTSTLPLPYCTVSDVSAFPPPPEWASVTSQGQAEAISRCLLPGIV